VVVATIPLNLQETISTLDVTPCPDFVRDLRPRFDAVAGDQLPKLGLLVGGPVELSQIRIQSAIPSLAALRAGSAEPNKGGDRRPVLDTEFVNPA
jgi:hypothetical protein